VDNALRLLERRVLAAQTQQAQLTPERAPEGAGDPPQQAATRMDPCDGAPAIDRESLAAFLSGATDDDRIARLAAGLAWVQPGALPARRREGETPRAPKSLPPPLPAAFAVLAPLFRPDAQLHRLGLLPAEARLPLSLRLLRLLAANRTEEAIGLARQRLRASGLEVPFRDLRAPARSGPQQVTTGPRLAAALMLPLPDCIMTNLARRWLAAAGDDTDDTDDTDTPATDRTAGLTATQQT